DSRRLLGQKFERALERELRILRAVTAALVAIETVARARIDEQRILRIGVLDLLDVGQRDRRVLVTEVVQDRAARFLVEHLRDAAAVVRDRRIELELAGRNVSDGAAPAEADDGGAAGAARLVRRSLQVGQRV